MCNGCLRMSKSCVTQDTKKVSAQNLSDYKANGMSKIALF